ncbi:pirin family protein [Herbiconiux sp. L3-i23]|uniref:pirin family protein n=1 Tax=Herbiconiux sp. L3-i23 TaxID=2905871 RepID=UPI00204DEADC|nr:pirin family protein [Herbiconiux sp. L3-i23]BDI22632.1 hypothetical protein L3i23_14080 [Herbiconiux sp. L3-i23]
MTNLERDPGVVTGVDAPARSAVEVLTPRDVPLGGVRSMTVRRTLPQRRRSLIGAWCFVDHYGPDDVAATGGMRVPGHPHTGLQTVTWLFEGEVEHRDTVGTVSLIRPGEVNLMTSGHGIAHSEYSTPLTSRLHGAQLWIALPDGRRAGQRDFQHYAAPQVVFGGARLRVFLGELVGESSPIRTWSRVVGAEIALDPDASLDLPVDAGFEHGVLVDTGSVRLDGVAGEAAELLFSAAGTDRLHLQAGSDGARLLLIGGEPFGEEIVMWWNFIGRSHEEIAEHRRAWQARVATFEDGSSGDVDDFGAFPVAWDRVLPAPELPTVRLKPRR